MLQSFDHRELRHVLGSFVTGVTVVTTVDAEGICHGLTANSFSSVSLDPPLVLWSQANASPSRPVFEKAERFAVNILAEDQVDLSDRFARSGLDKFANLDVDTDSYGVPILKNTSAWLACRLVSALPGGDHTIFIGQVEQISRTARRPLVFGGGKYLVADFHDLVPAAAGEPSMEGQLHAIRLGGRVMARLATEFDQSFALAVWGSHGPTVVNWAPSRTPPRRALPVGLTLPVTSTATGLAFSAHLQPQLVTPFVVSECGRPPTAEWDAELGRVRHDRLAVTIGRYGRGQSALSAMSVPVRDASGDAVLTITAVGDADRFKPDIDSPLAVSLRAQGESLSHRLGYARRDRRDDAGGVDLAGAAR